MVVNLSPHGTHFVHAVANTLKQLLKPSLLLECLLRPLGQHLLTTCWSVTVGIPSSKSKPFEPQSYVSMPRWHFRVFRPTVEAMSHSLIELFFCDMSNHEHPSMRLLNKFKCSPFRRSAVPCSKLPERERARTQLPLHTSVPT